MYLVFTSLLDIPCSILDIHDRYGAGGRGDTLSGEPSAEEACEIRLMGTWSIVEDALMEYIGQNCTITNMKRWYSMKKNKYVRLIDKLWEDCIFPGFAGMPITDKRHKAIMEILCRMPEKDYQQLVSMIDDFHWFVPSYNGRPSYAGVYPFTRNTDDELGEMTINLEKAVGNS
jgi:hypothetical protein